MDLWHPELDTWQRRYDSVHLAGRRERLAAMAQAHGVLLDTSATGGVVAHLHAV